MVRMIALVCAGLCTNCVSEPQPEGEPSAESADASCPSLGGGCEVGKDVGGACDYDLAPAGTICGGDVKEPQHGECDGVDPWCKWTDYRCKYNPAGSVCPNGHCASGECCQFCIDKTGACVGVVVNGKTISGGVPCP